MEQRKFLDILNACEHFPHYKISCKERFIKVTLYMEVDPFPKREGSLTQDSRIFNLFIASPREIVDWIMKKVIFIRSYELFYSPKCRDIAMKFFIETGIN